MSNDIKLFISYSWDDDEHKEWVLNLATKLIEDYGVDVILDQFELSVGKNLTYFMERSLEIADKVILILSPKYKEKAENRERGVGHEYSMISQELYELQSENNKFIPVLRKGDYKESLPRYIKGLIYHDMRDDSRFESDLFDLGRIIYDKPKVVKPKRGTVPNFDSRPTDKDPIIEKARHLSNQLEFKAKKESYLSSRNSLEEIANQFTNLINILKSKAEFYKNQTGFHFALYPLGHPSINIHWNMISYANLIGEGGICIHFRLLHHERCFTVAEWNAPPRMNGDNRFYFPGEEPKQLSKPDYYFLDIDEFFNPKWRDSNDNFLEIEEISKKYLVKLMDRIIQKKTE